MVILSEVKDPWLVSIGVARLVWAMVGELRHNRMRPVFCLEGDLCKIGPQLRRAEEREARAEMRKNGGGEGVGSEFGVTTTDLVRGANASSQISHSNDPS